MRRKVETYVAWLVECREKTESILTFGYVHDCMSWCHTITTCLPNSATPHHAWSKYRWILAPNGHFLVDHWQKCYIMKSIHVVILIFLCIVRCGNASIWIKNVISYGPSAANVGVKCLSKMSQLYLNDVTLTRSRTLVVAYTRNLSIPADNIQRLYLKWLHEAIIYGELDEYFIFPPPFFFLSFKHETIL